MSRRVLWVILEGHTADLFRSLVGFGVDGRQVFITTHLPNGLNSLRQIVTEVRPDLVVIDTLSAFAERYIEDMSGDSAGWTKLMNALGGLARDSDVALLLLHHARKSDGRYRDSTAIGAGCDMILEMEEVPEDITLRKITPRGRWALDPFGVRLEDRRFVLADRAPSVEMRVLEFIRANPLGVSLSAIRASVSGRATDKDAAIRTLLQRRMIVDEGGEHSHRYRVLLAPDNPGPSELWPSAEHGTPSGDAAEPEGPVDTTFNTQEL